MTTVHGLNSPSRYSAILASGERVVCVSGCVREHVLRHYPATDPARLVVDLQGADLGLAQPVEQPQQLVVASRLEPEQQPPDMVLVLPR